MTIFNRVEGWRILGQKPVPCMLHAVKAYSCRDTLYSFRNIRTAFPRISGKPNFCVITTRTAAQHTLLWAQDRHTLRAAFAKNTGIDTP
jgi:hypothetical protein